VIYLELRAVPRVLPKKKKSNDEEVGTKRDYVETILKVMEEFQEKITCRLLITVDRSAAMEEAEENILLAMDFKKETFLVNGIAVCRGTGDDDIRGLFPLLERAREENNLRFSIDCGLAPCSDAQNEAVLDFLTIYDRVGHAMFLPHNLQDKLAEKEIPVEICPTTSISKLKNKSQGGDDDNNNESSSGINAEDLKRHPQLQSWCDNDHPMCVCADNPGTDSTDTSNEWFLVGSAFGWSLPMMHNIIVDSIYYSFCDEVTRDNIQKRLKEFMMQRNLDSFQNIWTEVNVNAEAPGS